LYYSPLNKLMQIATSTIKSPTLAVEAITLIANENTIPIPQIGILISCAFAVAHPSFVRMVGAILATKEAAIS
jgi:hypothetical protein